MIVYKLEIINKYDSDCDFTLGLYSTKKVAQYAFNRFVKMNDKAATETNLKHNEEWLMYEEEHSAFISEYILDDFTWDE